MYVEEYRAGRGKTDLGKRIDSRYLCRHKVHSRRIHRLDNLPIDFPIHS